MKNEMFAQFEVFDNAELGHVSATMDKNGEIWFAGGEICDALDITNHRNAYTRLKESQKYKLPIESTGRGGARFMMLISESGMYRLILKSRKRSAEAFQDWITDEVLPSIRKNGGYVMGEESLPAADRAELDEEIKALREKVAKKAARIHELTAQNAKLHAWKAQAKKEAQAQDEYASIIEGISEGYHSRMMQLSARVAVLEHELRKLTGDGDDGDSGAGAGAGAGSEGLNLYTDGVRVFSSREEYLEAKSGLA